MNRSRDRHSFGEPSRLSSELIWKFAREIGDYMKKPKASNVGRQMKAYASKLAKPGVPVKTTVKKRSYTRKKP